MPTATDYQRLDPDAEEGHRWFGVVQPDLDRLSRRVWISGWQRQLLAGTRKNSSSHAAGQRQTQDRGTQ